MSMSAETREAILACIATRGPRKGRLVARCPKRGTAAAAAWQGIVTAFNPYKCSVFAIMMLRPEHMPIYREALAWADDNPDLRWLDHDRAVLDRLGAW